MERDKINEDVREVGTYFMQRLDEIRAFFIVGGLRGVCLMACVECVVSYDGHKNIAAAQRVDEFCQEKGRIVRAYENLCISSLPLIIDKSGIDQIIDILQKSIIANGQDKAHDQKNH